MIESGTPPDVVLDLSDLEESSEVAKELCRTLGLPTVTSSEGEMEDIKEWSELTAEQQKYLIQVRPPTDMFPFIIKDLVNLTKTTSAAILYDESFRE